MTQMEYEEMFAEKDTPAGVGTDGKSTDGKCDVLLKHHNTTDMIKAIGMVAAITITHPRWDDIVWNLRQIRDILTGVKE